jgi:hypothetical protein
MAETGPELNWAPFSKCDSGVSQPSRRKQEDTLIFTSSGLDPLTTSEGNTDVFSNKHIFFEELTGCPLKNWPLPYMTAYLMAL